MQPVTEAELIERSTSKRVTLEQLESSIAKTYFINAGEAIKALELPESEEVNVLTLCVLVLNNGWTIIGKSGCADPSQYKKDIGERLALEDAKKQIWPLLGYLLKEEIYLSGSDTFQGRMVQEARELQGKVSRLNAFIGGETYKSLSVDQQNRLLKQREHMQGYLWVLVARIEAF